MPSQEIKVAIESLKNLTKGTEVTQLQMEHSALVLTELEILQDMGSIDGGGDSRELKAKLDTALKTISDRDTTIKDLTSRVKELELNNPELDEPVVSKFDSLDLPAKCIEMLEELYEANDFILADKIKASSDCSAEDLRHYLAMLYDSKLAVCVYPPTEDDSEPIAKVKISLDGKEYMLSRM